MIYMDHLKLNLMLKHSYEDFEHLLFLQSDDYGFLSTEQVKLHCNLEIQSSLHVEDVLDFFYFNQTQTRLNNLLEI